MCLSLVKEDTWMSWRLTVRIISDKEGWQSTKKKWLNLIVSKEQCSKSCSKIFRLHFFFGMWSFRTIGIANRIRTDLSGGQSCSLKGKVYRQQSNANSGKCTCSEIPHWNRAWHTEANQSALVDFVEWVMGKFITMNIGLKSFFIEHGGKELLSKHAFLIQWNVSLLDNIGCLWGTERMFLYLQSLGPYK